MARRTKAQLEEAKRIHEMLERINAVRVAQKVCRHCGGKVPCWSESGDQAVGIRHSRKSLKAFLKAREGAGE